MVMKAMRTGTKPVLWIVVVAFVGTIVFAWGMDFTSRPAARGIVGEVNGYELKLDDFSFLYQNALAQRQQQTGSVTDDESRQIQDQVFEQMVQNKLLTDVIDELGLGVTNRELAEQLKRFPPAEIQQADIFRTNGQFDYSKYLQAYNNPDPQLWIQIEAIARPRILQQKLYEYVTATTLVDDAEIRDLYNAATEKVSVRYILAGTNNYRDSIVAVDSAAVRAYYAENQDEFRHLDRAKVRYATFETKPSAGDSAVVLHEAQEVMERARDGEDFAELARTFTDDEGTPDGSLGWFGKGRMVKVFEDVAFAMDSGDVSEPVLSQFGYHIIKLNGRRGIGDSVEVDAAHVLLRLDASPSTISDLRLAAEQFSEEAQNTAIDSLAKQYQVLSGMTGYIEVGQTARGGLTGNALIREFTLTNSVGAASPPIQTTTGYSIVVITEKDPEGVTPIAQVHGRILAKLRTSAAQQYAVEALQPLANTLAGGGSLVAAATEAGLTVDSTAPFGRLDPIPTFGADPVFRGLAYSLTIENPISAVGKINRGATILELIERTTADPQAFAAQRDSLLSTSMQGKRQLVFNSWFAQLRDNADINDFRYQLPGGGF